MDSQIAVIGLVTLLVVIVVAFAGLRVSKNNKVYGAETDAYAGSFRMFQEQINSLSTQISANAEKATQVQQLLVEANRFISDLQLTNEKLVRRVARLEQQIRSLGATPIE